MIEMGGHLGLRTDDHKKLISSLMDRDERDLRIWILLLGGLRMFAVSIQGSIHVISHLPGPLSNHVLLSNKFTPRSERGERTRESNKQEGREKRDGGTKSNKEMKRVGKRQRVKKQKMEKEVKEEE